jgi:hypothetical protein
MVDLKAQLSCLLNGKYRLLHLWHHNGSIRQQNDKEHLPQRPLDRVREANEPKRDRRRAKFLSLKSADLYVIKSRHKVCGDLCHFLFGYGIGGILFTTVKDVLQRAAVLGRASVAKQLDGERWSRKQGVWIWIFVLRDWRQ